MTFLSTHPAKNFNKVDFPLPAVPTIAVIDPTGISIRMGCNTVLNWMPFEPASTDLPPNTLPMAYVSPQSPQCSTTLHLSTIARPGLIDGRAPFVGTESGEERFLGDHSPLSMTPRSPTASSMRR